MLEPNNRSLLTEQLRPPRGFDLVRAVGTTFTLDLSTALSVPLSFASQNFAVDDDLGIIATLSRYTDRITVFTQAGEIRLGIRSDLVALLEEVVHPVHPPHGIFHPKVWLLEFASGKERRFRFVCNSRNLTEDRSWDLSVRLDGVAAKESECEVVREQNQPLIDFLETLPRLAVRPLTAVRTAELADFTEQIASVCWELPPGVSKLKFHFLDGGATRERGAASSSVNPVEAMLSEAVGETLIISPFISADGIAAVNKHSRGRPTVVSRAESLDRLPAQTVKSIGETLVLDDLLALNDDDRGEALSGLHAKAIFTNERRNYSQARALIGSANATAGGLRNNVEMMVELRGHVRDLGPSGVREALGEMVVLYTPSTVSETELVEDARRSLEARVRALAAGEFHVRVERAASYGMRAWCEGRASASIQRMESESITVRWRPVSQTSGGAGLTVDETTATTIDGLRLIEITPFLNVSVSQIFEGQRISVSTVVLAELHGDPPKRRDTVLAHGITNREQFMRLLLLLLDPSGGQFLASAGIANGGQGWTASEMSKGLFESLLKALASDDDGIDIAHRFLTQLGEESEGGLDLGEEFKDLWNSVWEARRAASGRAK